MNKPKSKRGFASMPADQQKEIASMGGNAISSNRTHMAEIGSKGGKVHSSDHMAEIGRKGGQKVSQNRRHMADIGKKGGEASKRKQSTPDNDEQPVAQV